MPPSDLLEADPSRSENAEYCAPIGVADRAADRANMI